MSRARATTLCACPSGPTACQQPFCPYFHRSVELLGSRWTGTIVHALLRGVRRFSDLRACIPDLSDRMLSERLKELECEGLVERTVIPETPVRIEYALTAKGRALEPVVMALLAWAGEWLPPPGSQPGAETDDAASSSPTAVSGRPAGLTRSRRHAPSGQVIAVAQADAVRAEDDAGA